MRYVIGDVHGCFSDLKRLLDIIEKRDKEAEILLLGDLVDRGTGVMETLQWAMEHISEHGKYQSVRGNHEQMIIEWYEKQWLPWWNMDGSRRGVPMPETRYRFSECIKESGGLTEEKLGEVIQFFRKLPLQKNISVVTKEKKQVMYRIAHAWPVEEGGMEQEEREYYNLWHRNYVGYPKDDNTIIIHGHTPTVIKRYYATNTTAPGMIGYRSNTINLDGGCSYGESYSFYPCMLCAICLETLEEIYPYTLEERFRQLNKGKSDFEIEKIFLEYKNRYLKEENPYRMELLRKIDL